MLQFVCVLSLACMLAFYIKSVFWQPIVHLVGECCQPEVEVISAQLNRRTALLAKAMHNIMSSFGSESLTVGVMIGMNKDSHPV